MLWLEDVDADTWRQGGEVGRIAGGQHTYQYIEAERRWRECCWRTWTQIKVGWKEREGRMLEDMEVDIRRLGGEGGLLEDMNTDD